MKRKSHSPEHIVRVLRQADAIIGQSGAVEQACKQLGISEATAVARQATVISLSLRHDVFYILSQWRVKSSKSKKSTFTSGFPKGPVMSPINSPGEPFFF